MLEGVFVILHVVIEVVGIGKEATSCGEDVGGGEIGGGECQSLGILYLKDFLGVVVEVFAQLIAQIGIDILVAHNANGFVRSDRSVVGSDNNVVI